MTGVLEGILTGTPTGASSVDKLAAIRDAVAGDRLGKGMLFMLRQADDRVQQLLDAIDTADPDQVDAMIDQAARWVLTLKSDRRQVQVAFGNTPVVRCERCSCAVVYASVEEADAHVHEPCPACSPAPAEPDPED